MDVPLPSGGVLDTAYFSPAPAREIWDCLPTVSHLNQPEKVILWGPEIFPGALLLVHTRTKTLVL